MPLGVPPGAGVEFESEGLSTDELGSSGGAGVEFDEAEDFERGVALVRVLCLRAKRARVLDERFRTTTLLGLADLPDRFVSGSAEELEDKGVAGPAAMTEMRRPRSDQCR